MNGLIDEGVRVDLLLSGTQTADVHYLRPEIRILDLDKRRMFRGTARLSDYLNKEHPVALLAGREWANRNAILARGLTKVQTRIWLRVGTYNFMALRRRHFLNRWTRKASMRYCYRRAYGLIAVSKGIAEDIASTFRIPEKKIHVLHNPSVTSDMAMKANQTIDHPWFQGNHPPVILGMGRLARVKDFPTLLRAFAKVRSARDCRLVILGEGKERDNLSALAHELGIQEDVNLPGYKSNPFAYMNAASLYVLSSVWEGSPNTLIEALAVGVPVVSTDCRTGPREILEGGRYGRLVPVGDVEALARAIEVTLDNPPKKAYLQSAAARYRVDRCAQAYLRLFIEGL
jgi:glycosyltransferase involved in cell wall biosynthesis